MLKLIGFEFFKMSRKPRTYLGAAAFVFFNILILLALKYGGIAGIMADQASGQNFQVVGSPINAAFFAWLILGSPVALTILGVWLPFFTCLVTGEIVAGEYSDGTLRPLLSQPISRMKLLGSKLTACVAYTVLLVIFLGAIAYLLGWIWFGRGALMSTGSFTHPMLTLFPEAEGLQRLLLAYLITSVYALCVGSIALFISVWLNNSIGAIGGAMLLTFVTAIMTQIPYFKTIAPYLFSDYVFLGQKVFLDPVPRSEIYHGLEVLGLYILIFTILSALIFKRKDILA